MVGTLAISARQKSKKKTTDVSGSGSSKLPLFCGGTLNVAKKMSGRRARETKKIRENKCMNFFIGCYVLEHILSSCFEEDSNFPHIADIEFYMDLLLIAS